MLSTLLILVLILLCMAALAAFKGWALVHPPHLPPTRNKARKMLPVLLGHAGRGTKRCGSCYSFEPTGMPELQRRAPAAAEAARWLTPSQMSATEKPWVEASGFDSEGQPTPILGGPRWEDIGICHAKPGVMTFPDNTCGAWK